MTLELIRPGKYRCTVCGRKFPLTEEESLGRVVHQCGKRDATCLHRGVAARLESCASCGWKMVQIKIFACAIHGECQLAVKIAGIRSCVGCPDRVSQKLEIVQVSNPVLQ